MATDRFPSPFDIPTPAGAEGWESMYDWYHLFGPERRELDEGRFWFADRLHHPDVLHPYDEIQCECWWQALGAFNTRIFAMPPAFGVDQRILNGRLYVTPVPAPAEDIAARAEEFGKRAGHYYERWDEIYAEWKEQGQRAAGRDPRRCASTRCPTSSPSRPSTSTSGHSAGIPDDQGLQPPGHHDVRDLPVPLRAAEHRLRRLPDVLRDVQERVPGHLRPVDLAHGRRPGRGAVPARRRAQAAGQGGGSGSAWATRSAAPRTRRRCSPTLRGERRRAPSGWPTGSAPPTRGSSSTPTRPPRRLPRAPDLGAGPGHPAGLGARVPAPARGRRVDRPADRRRCCASATGSPPSTAS